MAGWLAVSTVCGSEILGAQAPSAPAPATSAAPTSIPDTPPPKKLNTDLSAYGGFSNPSDSSLAHPKVLAKQFLDDQKQIWTSPAKLRYTDLGWIIPYGGFTSMLFFTDFDASNSISKAPNTVNKYNTISNASVAALLGGAGAMWALSYPKQNPHWRETGFLAGEAALNSLIVVEALKYPLGRERPNQGNGMGPFFSGGVSFPSEHATAAFAVAGVIAHEYPGPLTKIGVYALATLVDYSRFRARQHFPSDIFVGDVIGSMVAQNIYSRRHDPELGGEEWISASRYVREHWKPEPDSMGSPYVPLNSWVYQAIDRLVSAGLVHSSFLDMRPWTRLTCSILMNEGAATFQEKGGDSQEISQILSDLRTEFAPELRAFETGVNDVARVDGMYTRITGISGPPLNDSYHFGQTLYNDEGRPYQEGVSNITGISTYATSDRFAIGFSGEYQHSPYAPPLPLAARQAIANADDIPLPGPTPYYQINRFEMINGYVSTTIARWDFSFGRQDLWWGPQFSSSYLFSNNALPIYMFRASRVMPFYLPWIFKYLGPMQVDAFVGQLAENQYPPRPAFHGEKIAFKPTENVTVAFSRTVEFGGVGRPMTLGAIWESYVAFSSSYNYPAYKNPGHRVSGFDFSYRVPFLRNWLTVYADSMASDDPSPVDAPRRAAINPGLYLAKFPGLNKLTLRAEGIYTDSTTSRSNGGQFNYHETFYRDAYNNYNQLMGSWIGREAVGETGQITYWFTPKTNFQLNYRHQRVSSDFLPGAVTINDASANLSLWANKHWNFTSLLQWEQWRAPLLAQGLQKNWTSSVGVLFSPDGWVKNP